MNFDPQDDAYEEVHDLQSIYSELDRTMLRVYCSECNTLMIVMQATEKMLGVGNNDDEPCLWNICKACGKVELRGV